MAVDADLESVCSEQSSHGSEQSSHESETNDRSREASSVGESDSASPGPEHNVVRTSLPAGKV